MKTKEMTSRKRVSEKFKDTIKFDGASRPDEFLYAHHIGFTMRTVSKHVPPKGIRFHGNDVLGQLTSLPRAFHITKLPCNRWPTALFESVDTKIGIHVLHLEDKKRGIRLLNTDGDEVWFIHKGQGMCNTILGTIHYKAPAYLFVPKSYLYQICPSEETFMISIESREPLRRPVFSWINDTVPYVEHDLFIPDPVHCDDAPDSVFKNDAFWHIQIKRGGQWADASYTHSPFSCVGYQGYPYPFVLPTENISLPTLSKEHTDPTSFMTFVSSGDNGSNLPSVGVSTFLSHRMYSLPYFHTNVYDECLFLSETYKARGGVLCPGDMSFHPQGFPHGPHPEAMRLWKNPEKPEDLPHVPMLAVMFESQSPLIPTPALLRSNIEISNYAMSWKE